MEQTFYKSSDPTEDLQEPPLTVQSILDKWPNRAELARRLGKEPVVVQRWYARGSIPGKHDKALVAQAEKDGIALSLEDLANARDAA